jgi:hypothetical protein
VAPVQANRNDRVPRKAKAPHQGEECEAFQTARWGEGERLAVRLMSGQRMDARYRGDFANSSNGLQQCVLVCAKDAAE